VAAPHRHSRAGIPLADRVRAHLGDLLASEQFSRSERLSAFLAYVVEQALSGRAADLKERNIAVDVYGKGTDFDASVDPVVRVDARRVRDKLREYYAANRSGDVVIILPKGSYRPTFEDSSSPTASLRRRAGGWMYRVALLATVAAFVLVGIRRYAPDSGPVFRVLLRPPEGVQVADLRTTGPPLLSPDGRSVAFIGTTGGKPRVIWVQKLDSAEALPLANTEDASYPFWSPDATQLGFFAEGKLKKVDVASGAVQTLADAPSGRGGAWSPAGALLFSPRIKSPILRIGANGGAVASVTSPQGGESHLHPSLLPGGERFMYHVQIAGNLFELRIGSITDPSLNRKLFTVNSHAAYASGYLLFVRESFLSAVALDADASQVSGEVRAIAAGVASAPERPVGDFSFSANGALLYRHTARRSPPLAWFDGRGSVLSATGARSDRDVSLSTSGRFVSTVEFGASRGTIDLWLHDFERGTRARITSGEGTKYTPVWSQDERTLYFSAHEVPHYFLYRQDVLAAGDASRLTERADWFAVTDVAPDGKLLLLQTRTSRGDHDLLQFNTATRVAEPLLATTFNEVQGRISPDGRWLAYVSDETRRHDVYVSPLDNTVIRIPVSQSGGVQPRWRRDGKALFFISLDGDLMTVAPPWQKSAPTKLFATGIDAKSKDAVEFTQFAVSADGERFLLPVPIERQPNTPWMLVANWPAAVRAGGSLDRK
jgi:eukaryotic-like serine/threonine-protein kinase